MQEVLALSTPNESTPLAPATISRREPGENDIQIEILFCGVCHSDLHQARNEWHDSFPTMYPCVPGHEIVGRVTKVGSGVTGFAAGDLAAVGCMVDSCGVCPECTGKEEQFCHQGATFTYNMPDPHTGGHTFGGYSKSIVVNQRFALHVPANLDPAGVAPLLCAGITTWSPLRRWGAGPGKKVGIVGLGGLGHMGLKFASSFGCHTVLFTTSPGKKADGLRLGAKEVVISTDAEAMGAHFNSFDLILDTVSGEHNINAYLPLLKKDCAVVLVGAPEKPLPVASFPLLFGRHILAGSIIGGTQETQEMLDYCGQHNIVSDIEIISAAGINAAFERLLKADVRYRFVIDLATL